jgi:2-amino-4-hydroxy-6-hydroxymethyldihydropteridine diphosphokinase
MENQVYLLLGGNQGDVRSIFSQTLELIHLSVGKVKTLSPVYRSEPWGFEASESFLNQVILVNTSLDPEDLLKEILDIERKMGRVRNHQNDKYDSRPIDIDILFYNDNIITSENLIIPHPRLHLRNFTLVPLNDISPDFCHPVFKKTISDLVKTCDDKLGVFPA